MARPNKETIKKTIDEIEKMIENGNDCENWYKQDSDMVKKTYCAFAAKRIFDLYGKGGKLPIKFDENDKICTFSKGDREQRSDAAGNYLDDIEKMKFYISHTDDKGDSNRHEERMCHLLYAQDFGDFEVLDFQVPTTDGAHDKIDLLIKDKKDGTIYMTETKKFSPFEKSPSDETMLRCVLEIQTYYQKITDVKANLQNFAATYAAGEELKLKKAVLLDEDTTAYKQKDEPWAKDIIDCFDITLLKLSMQDTKFVISK